MYNTAAISVKTMRGGRGGIERFFGLAPRLELELELEAQFRRASITGPGTD